LGIRFTDFVLLAADTIDSRSIVVMKHDEDKFVPLSKTLLMAVTGESGDTTQFSEYISKNIQLYKMKNDYELSPRASAHFTRKMLADSLRSQERYNVNLLMAGYDEVEKKAELYYMDYLASMMELPYCAHGYGSMFVLGCMDAYYKPDMSVEQAYELMKRCVAEISKRFSISLPTFMVKVVDKDGIHDKDPILARQLVI